MSRIYFHTQHEGTSEVLGSERARMGVLCTGVVMATIPRWRESVITHLNPVVRGLLRDQYFMGDLRMMLSVGDDPVFMFDGEPLANLSLVLNTVLAISNDPMCLYARLHGQCEIHTYVEGVNRTWLAAIIQDGLNWGIYRLGAGWESVVTLLRNRDNEPVVTSYSVCESFPNRDVADWVPSETASGDDENEDAWYNLDVDERWRLGMNALRADSKSLRELKPEDLRGLFKHEKTMFDVFSVRPENSVRPEKGDYDEHEPIR